MARACAGFLPTYGLRGCCMHPLWAKQTRRTDFDVVWWSNGGLHYLHSGERTGGASGLPGVLGASLTSYLQELRACSAQLRATYARAVHIYKLSNWVCSDSFTGPWRDNVRRYTASVESPKHTLAFNEIGSLALHAAERELGRDGDGTGDDQGTEPYQGPYDRGEKGPAHVLQDSLTTGRCACTCDGVHYPLIMPALIVQLARKIDRLDEATRPHGGMPMSPVGPRGGALRKSRRAEGRPGSPGGHGPGGHEPGGHEPGGHGPGGHGPGGHGSGGHGGGHGHLAHTEPSAGGWNTSVAATPLARGRHSTFGESDVYGFVATTPGPPAGATDADTALLAERAARTLRWVPYARQPEVHQAPGTCPI